MSNEIIEQSQTIATPEVDPSVNQDQLQQTEEVVVEQPKEQPRNSAQERIRALANEKNEYKNEVTHLREQLIQQGEQLRQLTEKPLVEPDIEAYGNDMASYTKDQYAYQDALKEQKQREAYIKAQEEQTKIEATKAAWQDKIDALPEEKRNVFHDKIAPVQAGLRKLIPESVLNNLTENSPVGPEVLLEIVDNPNLVDAIQKSKSVHEISSIIGNVENHFAAQRYGIGKNIYAQPTTAEQAPVDSAQPADVVNSNITGAAPAMPDMRSSSTGVNPTDPRKLPAKEFQQWYLANRKR